MTRSLVVLGRTSRCAAALGPLLLALFALQGCGGGGTAAEGAETATDGSGGQGGDASSTPDGSDGVGGREDDGRDAGEAATNDASDEVSDDAADGGDGGDERPDPADGSTDALAVRCPAGGLQPGDYSLRMTHAGVSYGYLVHIPKGLDPTVPAPLVLNWHGLSSNAVQQRLFSNMNPVADAHGFIVVYPDSPDTTWNAGVCCAFLAPNRDDVGFAVALVDEMKKQSCIDAKRVYSTGMSNGGYMSHRLACERADVFAAIAPVAGGLNGPPCNPSRPVPVIQFHGTGDNNVPYGGNSLDESIPDTLQHWADRDGCTSGPTVTFSKDDATCEVWTGCRDGVEVKLCSFRGEGHCWPGQAFCPFGAATTTLSANEEAWKFFERFHL